MQHISCSVLTSIMCGIPRALWQHRIMTWFKTYFDESATGDGGTMMVVGYGASAEGWARLIQSWGEALEEWKIPYFHMSYAEGLQKSPERGGPDFSDWGDVLDDRLSRLAYIVRKNVLFKTGVIIDGHHYRTLGKSAAKKIKGIDSPRVMADPYSMLSAAAMAQLSAFCSLRGLRPSLMRPIFGEIKKGQTQVKINCVAVADHFGLQTPDWADARTEPALQAADIVAWLVKKAATDANGEWERPCHANFKVAGRVRRFEL